VPFLCYDQDLRDALQPLAASLDELALAARDVFGHILPLDPSPCMLDLANEEGFRTTQSAIPITNTLGYSSMLGVAAVDGLRGFAHHLTHPDLLIWAHLVNARACLDAAAYAFWLGEPGIGTAARVERGIAMRLHNAAAMKRAPVQATVARENATRVRDSAKAAAAELNLSVSGQKAPISVGTSTFPTPRNAIAAVLSYRTDEDLASLADLLWWMYSGFTHGAPYALMMAVGTDESEATAVDGVRTAPLSSDGNLISTAAFAVATATANAAIAHASYQGRSADEVASALLRTRHVNAGIRKAIRATAS